MRTITHIAVHCTATQPSATIEAIQNYWKNTLGWQKPGYHYLIKSDGQVVQLLDIASPSNGVAGWNSRIINVSYIGGIDAQGAPKDTRTPAQKDALSLLLLQLKKQFPNAIIQGHRDFPNVRKACPSFNAKAEYSNLR